MNKEEFGNLVEDTLDKMQQEGLVATVADANAPIDCTDDAHGAFLAHAHIVDEMIDEDL
jgi:Fe2+ or Zn2+ uptake regulation protein